MRSKYWKCGTLPKSCKLCQIGKKLDLAIFPKSPSETSLLNLSDITKVDIFANERPILSFEDLVQEVQTSKAQSIGIFGQPFLNLSKTLSYILFLRKEFSNNVHIHLTLNVKDLTAERIKRLNSSTVDEIQIRCKNILKEMKFLECVKQFKRTAVVILQNNPTEKEVKLLSTNNVAHLITSRLEKPNINGINISHCSKELKEEIKTKKMLLKDEEFFFDKITLAGSVIRGAAYANGNYSKKRIDRVLEATKEELINEFNLYEDEIKIDKNKQRIICSEKVIEKTKNSLKEMGFQPFIVEEYPTFNRMVVSRKSL